MLTANEELKLQKDAAAREIMNLRVFVVGGGHQYVKMFYDAGFLGARNVEDADIVCFTGGEDVSPDLYNEKPLDCTHFNPKRDQIESYIYGECLALKKPMVGICRGGQFLNVMNDGSMWQDVNNHAVRGGHSIMVKKTGEILNNMTSTHHQMMIAGKNAEIIAVANLATHKQSEKIDWRSDANQPLEDDMEVLWYKDTLSLCFQPHPEFQHGECRNYFLELVDDFILPAT